MQTIRETPQDAAQAFTTKAVEFYVKYAQTACETAAAHFKAQAEKYERFAASAQASVQQPETAPVVVQPVATVAPVAAKAVKPRCPHYAEIRRFMATSRAKGLDLKATDRSRAAIGMLLGFRVESRADLTGRQWLLATQAVENGRLFW